MGGNGDRVRRSEYHFIDRRLDIPIQAKHETSNYDRLSKPFINHLKAAMTNAYNDRTIYTDSRRLEAFRHSLKKWSRIRIWDDDLNELSYHRVESFRIDPDDRAYAWMTFPYAGTSLITGEHRVKLDLVFPE